MAALQVCPGLDHSWLTAKSHSKEVLGILSKETQFSTSGKSSLGRTVCALTKIPSLLLSSSCLSSFIYMDH